MSILALFLPIQNSVSKTTMRLLSRIIPAMIAMKGRATMLGISRWAEKGGSYRTVQRFFYTVLPWAQVFWAFFCEHLLDDQVTYLLAGDECVVVCFPYSGASPKRGPRSRLGVKVDVRNLPAEYLKETKVEDGFETRTYQMQLLYQDFPCRLNAVILLRTNLATKAWANVILFSSDLELPYDKLIDYYSLRSQIEFNFRDAKQFWGLEDFMNVTQTIVTNIVNLALFMVDVSQGLMCQYR